MIWVTTNWSVFPFRHATEGKSMTSGLGFTVSTFSVGNHSFVCPSSGSSKIIYMSINISPASSRRSVSWGSARKSSARKNKKAPLYFFRALVFCAAPWLTERLEEVFLKLINNSSSLEVKEVWKPGYPNTSNFVKNTPLRVTLGARRIFNSLLCVWISQWNTVSRVWYIMWNLADYYPSN